MKTHAIYAALCIAIGSPTVALAQSGATKGPSGQSFSLPESWFLPSPYETRYTMHPHLVSPGLAPNILRPGFPYFPDALPKPTPNDVVKAYFREFVRIPKSQVGFHNTVAAPVTFVVTTSPAAKAIQVELGPHEFTTIPCGACPANMKASVETGGQKPEKREVTVEGGGLFRLGATEGVWLFYRD